MKQHYCICGMMLVLLLNHSFPGLLAVGSKCAKTRSSNPKPKAEELYLKFNDSYVDWDDGFKNCGFPMEDCTDESESLKTPCLSYMSDPTYCRCDKECVKYGDCCVTVLKEIQKIPKEHYWRCIQLPVSPHAVRMISKCPSSFSNSLIKNLCEDSICPSIPNNNSLCPLLNVPVLHNQTRDLYRNIYCAHCHSIFNKELYKVRPQIYCSQPFKNNADWEAFRKQATYKLPNHTWHDPMNSSVNCTVYLPEFQPIVLKDLVSNLRFCEWLAKEEENCSMEFEEEERDVIHNLCHSYTQVVFVFEEKNKTAVAFKNPHCAKCIEPNIDIRRGSQCNRLRDRYSTIPCGSVYPNSQIYTSPVLSFPIDFKRDVDVGRCNDFEEILDLIRLKCVPIFHREDQSGSLVEAKFNTMNTLFSLLILVSIFVLIIYNTVPFRRCSESCLFKM